MASSSPSRPSSRPRSRSPWPGRLWGLALVASLLWVGLVVGTALGARFFVPEGSGLAGPAIALGYGALGMAAGLVLGLAGWLLSPERRRTVALVALALAGVCVVLVGWRILVVQAGAGARGGGETPLPPPATFRLEATLPATVPTRSFRRLVVDGASWTFSYRAVGPEAAHCEGRLVGAEARALDEALADLRRLAAGGPVCPPAGSEESVLTLRLEDVAGGDRPESDGPETDGLENNGLENNGLENDGLETVVTVTSRCLREQPRVAELQHLLWRLPLDATGHGRVTCSTP